MDLCFYVIIIQEFIHQERITGGNTLALQGSYTGIFLAAGNGYSQAAFAKAQFLHDLGLLVLFKQYVFAYDTNIGHTIFHILRNIIVAQEKYLQGEIIGLGAQTVFYIAQGNTAFFKQLNRILVQAA